MVEKSINQNFPAWITGKDILCSGCGVGFLRVYGGYCNKCHAAYMRQHRPKYCELTPEQKAKSISRAYANSYQKRGKIKKSSCALCGAADTEKHHEDYARPLHVQWLCRVCHTREHQNGNF